MAAKFDLVVAAKTVGAASIKRLGNSMQGVQGRVKNLRMAMSGLNKTFATLGLILLKSRSSILNRCCVFMLPYKSLITNS